MANIVSILANLSPIDRYFLAILWGAIVAWFIQFTSWGRWIASELTILSVIIGCLGNAAISYPSDWFTIWVVFVCSSFGLIVRSLYNLRVTMQEERRDAQRKINIAYKEASTMTRKDQYEKKYYNMLHAVEEVRGRLLNLRRAIGILGKTIKTDQDGKGNATVLDIMEEVQQLREMLIFANDGGIEK